MNDLIARVKELDARATKGPWVSEESTQGSVYRNLIHFFDKPDERGFIGDHIVLRGMLESDDADPTAPPASDEVRREADETKGQQMARFARQSANIVEPKERERLLVKGLQMIDEARHPKNAIATGHNPDRLTVKQVGDGWRLLEVGEIQLADDEWDCGLSKWAINKPEAVGNPVSDQDVAHRRRITPQP